MFVCFSQNKKNENTFTDKLRQVIEAERINKKTADARNANEAMVRQGKKYLIFHNSPNQ